MTTDSGGRISGPKPPDIWRLPEILAVRVQRVRYTPPRRWTVSGKDHALDEAIEITIETTAPFPVRALGPVLRVGDVSLSEAVGESPTRYRFLAPEPALLKAKAPIWLAWNSRGAGPEASRFHYDPPVD